MMLRTAMMKFSRSFVYTPTTRRCRNHQKFLFPRERGSQTQCTPAAHNITLAGDQITLVLLKSSPWDVASVLEMLQKTPRDAPVLALDYTHHSIDFYSYNKTVFFLELMLKPKM